ncbi:MAG: ribose 5-phosphate isomerase B [Candidatus Omnitrophota bacterium]|nr:ribose 5-phosphate isomerase B [Candidatus Omnitrophota bacterium]MBU1929343.1 ribose 5-phosphate isomerase B [Candidatus Omnitrophota bacterium]MBU2035635.1 ribose 5-phosphate isomerase B [Candidatus Omnitrophota bacterium]MBU2258841.1 ribose 5-phosphate isomerase B [Candidatus Omnitrophota bacterium]
MKNIAIASDHGGFNLKDKLKTYLVKKGFKVKDCGAFSEKRCDYPQFAYALARSVSLGKYKRGVLICKSGIGNSIVANKFPKVRAALCYNPKAAVLSRRHNDSNILVLGALFSKEKKALKILGIWLNTEFEGGRHIKRLNQIRAIERKIENGTFKKG